MAAFDSPIFGDSSVTPANLDLLKTLYLRSVVNPPPKCTAVIFVTSGAYRRCPHDFLSLYGLNFFTRARQDPFEFPFEIYLDGLNHLRAVGRAPPGPLPHFPFNTLPDVLNRLIALGYAPTAAIPQFPLNTHLDVFNRLEAFDYDPPAPLDFVLDILPNEGNDLNALAYAPPARRPHFALNIPPDVGNDLIALGCVPPTRRPDVGNYLNAFGCGPPAPRPHLALNIPPDVGNDLNALGVGLAYSFANASNGYNPGAQPAPPTSSYTSNVQTPPPDSQLLDDYKAVLPVLLPVNVGSIFAIVPTWNHDILSSYDRILICGIVCSAVAASVLSGVAHRQLHNPTTTHKWFAKGAITFTSLDIVGWMCILLPGVAKLVVMGLATLLCVLIMFAM